MYIFNEEKEIKGTERKIYTVTGATGYIGYKFIEAALKNGDFVYAIVRESSDTKRLRELQKQYGEIEIHSYEGHECDLELSIADSDFVVHLGALYTTQEDEGSTINLINSNILFSTQILNVTKRVNPSAVVISASTFSSLDGRGEYAPSSLYAATKSAVETIAEYYSTLAIRFLTFPDTFGPADWRPKIHNILAKNKSWPFEFRSPAQQEMLMLHIDDIIGHILEVSKDNSAGVKKYDIYTEGILVTLEELSKLITDQECLFPEHEKLTEIPKQARKNTWKTGYTNKVGLEGLRELGQLHD